MNDQTPARVFAALDRFRLEVPSWGFADTGTRFGVYRQPAAAVTVAEKLADAGFVHKLTGSVQPWRYTWSGTFRAGSTMSRASSG